jgi:hypothetical protein
VQGLSRPLRLASIAIETLVRFETTTESSFGLLFGVSFREGHGELLYTVWIVG